jgi:hypothetical protein
VDGRTVMVTREIDVSDCPVLKVSIDLLGQV